MTGRKVRFVVGRMRRAAEVSVATIAALLFAASQAAADEPQRPTGHRCPSATSPCADGRAAVIVARPEGDSVGPRSPRASPTHDDNARWILSVGPLFSVTGRTDEPTAVALGGEVSLNRYYAVPAVEFLGSYVGGIVQVQAVTAGPWRPRGVVAGQVGFSPIGIELGAFAEAASDQYRGAEGIHVAPFLTAGLAYVGLRVDVPLGGGSKTPGAGTLSGTEIGLVFALKWPIVLERSAREGGR